MPNTATTEFILVRHAPAITHGAVTGRRDLPLGPLVPSSGAALRSLAGDVDRVISSPAKRCIETAKVVFPEMHIESDPRLWEQDFGAWEGCAYGDLPNLGPLDRAALALHRPPSGESFADVCERVGPAILDHAPSEASQRYRKIAVVVHAGTIRAALTLALGGRPEIGLGFEIAPLSATLIRLLPGPAFTIGYVNRTAMFGVAEGSNG